jgi:ubiquinone/menaquinone biosynthesis C-methylase UbiE
MPTLPWTGKISFPLRIILNMGSIIAWLTGNARDSSMMKERMKDGYNGKYSDYINKYDELTSFHYAKISKTLIQRIDCNGKKVIDVGCGTGILSFLLIEKGAAKLVCVDQSRLMLDMCRKRSSALGYIDDLISFYEGDIESLPFADNTYDLVCLNMVLGMVPNQQQAIAELTRILRPGGTIALSVHGPAHYKEPIEAGVKSLNMRYFLGHRLEYWPRNENKIRTYFINSGLNNIQTERLTWIDKFENGGEVFDFFASSTGLWWYHRIPKELRKKEAEKTRAYFQRKSVTEVTSDVVFAFGSKIE